MIDFWNIESHIYIFLQPSVLFHKQKRNPQLMSTLQCFILFSLFSGWLEVLFIALYSNSALRSETPFPSILVWIFSSDGALHYAIKMLDKRELIYLTHMRYGVLFGLSRAEVMHEKISVKAFITTRCPVWCLTA